MFIIIVSSSLLLLVSSQRCPENSVFQMCGSSCPPTCENPYPEYECEEECVPSCACRPGFFKRRDGNCVPLELCLNREPPQNFLPPPQRGICGKDEDYYEECTPSCKNTCENFNNPGVRCRCAPPGCFCKEGLVKRSDGKCVPPQQCQSAGSVAKCPENAIFIECGSQCPPTCENRYPEPCEEKCTTACYCKPGYLKNKEGRCVRPQECQRKKRPEKAAQCPKNAIFIECGSPCPPTCDNRNPEPCEEKCTTACYCKPGYLKSSEGRCVRPEQCNSIRKQPPVQCPEDEVFYEECTPTCKSTCSNLNSPNVRCSCGPPGCSCKPGLVRRADGRCVNPRECPPKRPRCPENSVFMPCGTACPATCERPRPRNCVEQCVSACFCRPGYLQTRTGKCVPAESCPRAIPEVPPTSCPANSSFMTCGSACAPTCSNPRPQVCVEQCVAGCFCQPGFLKNENGTCVRPTDCRKKCQSSLEEYSECGPSCPDTCENQTILQSNDCPLRCVSGCFCKNGLLRTREGSCVTISQCLNERNRAEPRTIAPNPNNGLPTVSENRICPNVEACVHHCRSKGYSSGQCINFRQTQCQCSRQ